MNPDACTLVAQLIPVLLVASIFLDRQASALIVSTNPLWLRLLFLGSMVASLVAIFIAVQGVNGGGLDGVAALFVQSGLLAALFHVGLLGLYLYVLPAELRDGIKGMLAGRKHRAFGNGTASS